MTGIPRRDWEIVRDQVEKVREQVDELALLHLQGQIRGNVEDIIQAHEERFLGYIYPLRAVIEKNRELGHLLHHDLMGYFCLIHLLFQRLRTEEAETIHSMHQRALVMRYIIDAFRFFVPDECLTFEDVSLVLWLKSFKNFFADTFKSYHAEKREQVSLVTFVLPSKNVLVKINRSTVLLLLINVLQNAKEHGKAKRVVISLHEGEDEVFLEIVDDGVGIDRRNMEIMFRGGFSIINGFGLGLAQARERMEVMQGRIECVPHGGINKGAKFVLVFKKA